MASLNLTEREHRLLARSIVGLRSANRVRRQAGVLKELIAHAFYGEGGKALVDHLAMRRHPRIILSLADAALTLLVVNGCQQLRAPHYEGVGSLLFHLDCLLLDLLVERLVLSLDQDTLPPQQSHRTERYKGTHQQWNPPDPDHPQEQGGDQINRLFAGQRIARRLGLDPGMQALAQISTQGYCDTQPRGPGVETADQRAFGAEILILLSKPLDLLFKFCDALLR